MQTPSAVHALPAHYAPRAPSRPADHRRPLLILQLFLGIFFVVGALSEWREAHMLRSFRPVTATVLSSDVERVPGHSASSSSTWRPLVRYEFVAAGERRIADRVTPLRESRSARWASDIARAYVPGATTTAYYDPADPGDAFLVRRRSWLPWLFMLLPLGMLAVARWVEAKHLRSPTRTTTR